MSRFLVDKDYRWMVEPEDFSIIAYGNDEYSVTDAEEMAQEEIKKIIRGSRGEQYDLQILFKAPEEFNINTDYLAGDFVSNYNPLLEKHEFFICLVDAESEPLTNTTYWEKKDIRDKTIKKAIVVFATYFMYQHIHGKFLPERIEKTYQAVKKELEEIRDAKLVPNWQTVAPQANDNNSYFYFKGNPRRRFY